MELYQFRDGDTVPVGLSGDVIYALQTYAHQGSVDRLVLHGNHGYTEERARSLTPLLESQPYVKSVHWGWNGSGCRITHECRPYLTGERNLAQAFAVAVGLRETRSLTESPWIYVTPRRESRYVFSRTNRYVGDSEFWHKAVELYGNEAIFLGHQHEHADFEGRFGGVRMFHTDDLLGVAEVVAGSDVVFSNASAIYSISVGLGKPAVHETWANVRVFNSVFKRENILNIGTGETFLPYDVSRIQVASTRISTYRISTVRGQASHSVTRWSELAA